MKMKKINLFTIFLFAILSLQLQCDKGYDGMDIPEKYTFKEKVSISPYTLNYDVGDTIWLTVSIPGKKIFDEKTNTRVFYDSASFNTITQIDLLYNNPFIGNGPFASFIFPAGVSAFTQNSGGQTYASVTFGCSPSTDYHLSLGIVLIEKGAFSLSFYNSSIKKCFTENFENSRLTYEIDVVDTHKQFYQQLPLANIGKSKMNTFYKGLIINLRS